jgi:hypothetical protein
MKSIAKECEEQTLNPMKIPLLYEEISLLQDLIFPLGDSMDDLQKLLGVATRNCSERD